MDKYSNFDPSIPTLPNEYLVAIGRVTYIWGVLETAMDISLAKLAGINDIEDPRVTVMTTHMSWPQRMDALETFVELLIPENKHLERFALVKPMLKKAQEGRNRIIHARWSVEDNGNVNELKLTARGKLKIRIEPISVTNIDDIFNDIGAANTELMKLILNR